MLEAWAWGTYIFFAVFLGVGIIWVWFFLPETKGASLEEMDRVFKSNTGGADAILLAEARRDVGLNQDAIDSADRSATEKDDHKGDNKSSYIETV
jgi:Sugar (and other) transporter